MQPLIFLSLCGKIFCMNVYYIVLKKFVAFIAALSLILGLSSCSVRKQEAPPEPTASTTSHVVSITFPEGSPVVLMATLLEENGVCSAADFLAEANNPLNLEEFSFEIPDAENRAFLLEGYLFPDTYEFYRNESASSAIKRFLKNTEKKLDESIRLRCAELGFTLDEVLTLASIIQEEAGVPAEMVKVSSVLHNRLNSRSYPRLQCDVSVFYLKEYVKPHVDEVRYGELSELYNTYNCDGLPEGPITNSGIDAVKAALYPENTDYYFFITDNDGVYHYAETWAEHVDNCNAAGI